VRQATGKEVWAEKTPWNIRVLRKFLGAFPEARILHIVRDPRDVVLSLRKKRGGREWLRWAAIWLASVAAIQPYRARESVLELRYEELCTSPESTLCEMTEFLGVEFDWRYFNGERSCASRLTKARGHPRWRLHPGTSISDHAVGRHRESSVDWGFLNRLRLTPGYAALLGTRQWTAAELAHAYGYDIPAGSCDREERVYRPLRHARQLNSAMRWLDRSAGVSGYMAPVEYAGRLP
jgi:hypothetical protein